MNVTVLSGSRSGFESRVMHLMGILESQELTLLHKFDLLMVCVSALIARTIFTLSCDTYAISFGSGTLLIRPVSVYVNVWGRQSDWPDVDCDVVDSGVLRVKDTALGLGPVLCGGLDPGPGPDPLV